MGQKFSRELREAPPAHLLLKIESFSLLSQHRIRKYESGKFVAGGYKWKLIIHIDGDDEGQKDSEYISAYLSLAETSSLPVDCEVNAMLNIFLLNQIVGKYRCFAGRVQHFDRMNFKNGLHKMIAMKSLVNPSSGYVVDDNCVFGAEVAVVKSQRVMELLSVKVKDSCKKDFMIPGFSKLAGVWTSGEFGAGGHRWKLRLHPKGCGRGKGRCISIFMKLIDSKSFGPRQKLKSLIRISIKNKLGDAHFSRKVANWYTSSSRNWGYVEFMPIDEMYEKRFLVDDCCYLETEISVQAIVGNMSE